MKKNTILFSILFASTVAAAADVAPTADTSVTGVYYHAGKAVKGTFAFPGEMYGNTYFPASQLGGKFKNEQGTEEKIDFEKIDSVLIGDILFKKSAWSNKSVMSMSEDDLRLARVVYEGGKVTAFYAYGYDKKEKVFTKNLIVKKANSDDYVNTSSMKFSLTLKKQLAKLYEDCPEVSKKASEKAYGMSDAAVIAATKEYDATCK